MSLSPKDYIDFKYIFNVDLDDVVDFIGKNMHPEHIFDELDLDYWAIENGYITKDEWREKDKCPDE